jgi:hypothetical protein
MRILLTCAASLLLGLTSAAWSYPTQGNYPKPAPTGYAKAYGPKAAEISQGDIVFSASYPANLSDGELFTLFGSDSTRGGKGYRGLVSELLTVLDNYVAETGSLPSVITDDVIRTSYRHAGQDPEPIAFEMLRSPISGRYPRLDSTGFSAGDMYVRILTPAEVQEMAKWHRTLRNALQKKGKSKLLSKVYYMRVYGDREVILGGLKFAFTE